MKPCKNDPICLGGFGKKCNRDTQYHNQNRVYSSFTVAVSVTTSFFTVVSGERWKRFGV